jgi:YHS domain-containing protein
MAMLGAEGAMAGEGTSIDPICGRRVVEDDAESAEYRQKKYFFCSPGCRGRFERKAELIRVDELARMGALFAAKRATWGVA